MVVAMTADVAVMARVAGMAVTVVKMAVASEEVVQAAVETAVAAMAVAAMATAEAAGMVAAAMAAAAMDEGSQAMGEARGEEDVWEVTAAALWAEVRKAVAMEAVMARGAAAVARVKVTLVVVQPVAARLASAVVLKVVAEMVATAAEGG